MTLALLACAVIVLIVEVCRPPSVRNLAMTQRRRYVVDLNDDGQCQRFENILQTNNIVYHTV